MKKLVKKSMNAVLSFSLMLMVCAAIVIPAVQNGDYGISPMSDDLPIIEFYI